MKIIPTHLATIGAMLDGNVRVQATCDKCGDSPKVDLAKLVALKGRDYSLVDRRCRCRVKDCPGWIWFHGPIHSAMNMLRTERRWHQVMGMPYDPPGGPIYEALMRRVREERKGR